MGILRLFADVFASPARGLAAAADRKSFVPPILAATLVSLFFASSFVPRVDWERVARDQLEQSPAAAQLTPHQMEEAVTTARKLGAVTSYGGAVVGSAAFAVLAAFFLWMGLRVAGAKPGFLPSLAVASWGLLPSAVGRLFTVPALLSRPTVDPRAVGALVPWGAAYWLPAGAKGAALALATSVNLFTLWSAVLLAIGMSIVAQVSRARAGAVVAVLWALLTAAGMAAAAAAKA